MAERSHILDLRAGTSPAYVDDYAAWLEHQRVLMREHRLEELDLENLIDEVGDLGSEVFDKYASAIEVVLLHMLKWDFQSERRTRGWVLSILEHRRRLETVLAKNPSFKSRRDEAIMQAYRYAQVRAARETDMRLDVFPETCPYDWTAITSREHSLPGDDA